MIGQIQENGDSEKDQKRRKADLARMDWREMREKLKIDKQLQIFLIKITNVMKST